MAFRSKLAIVPFALLALLCFSGLSSVLASSEGSSSQNKARSHVQKHGELPQAVPDRSHIRNRQLRTITYMEFESEDLNLDDLMGPGDFTMGRYGYYSPPPAATTMPTDEPTATPTDAATDAATEPATETPSATLPPIPADKVFMRFEAKFAGGIDIVGNATKKRDFERAFVEQNDEFFNLTTGSTVLLGMTLARPAAMRRSLLQAQLTLDYAVILASSTDPAKVAAIRDQSVNTPAAVFGSVASQFGLPPPTVQLIASSAITTQPPTVGQSDNTPVTPVGGAPGGSAGVQRVSSLLTAVLAIAGSAMLMGML